jgi:hypothetical protein
VTDPERIAELQARGAATTKKIVDTIGTWQNNSARSQQSAKRVLGPSEVGHCREYVRATIAGDPKVESTRVKWAAFCGTAIGDMAERALSETLSNVVTQERLTCTLPRTGIKVTGSTDARFERDDTVTVAQNELIDFKTKDGLETIKREQPSLKELIQLSIYLVGALQAKLVDEEAIATLVYIDRSGGDSRGWNFTIDVEMAYEYLELAEQRLDDVTNALAAGVSQSYLRDMPESWCHHVQCPFRMACWGGEEYRPTGKIEHPELIAAVDLYVEGRDLAKTAKQYQNSAKSRLMKEFDEVPVEGETPRHRLKWVSKESARGDFFWQIDVREL